MTRPIPGKPVRGSKTGRPIMALLDLLGRRWALRVLWELRNGPVGVFPWKRGQLLTPEMLGVDLAGKDNRTA